MTDLTLPQSEDSPLTQVGWWCWRGDNHGHLATTACRSDNVPLYAPVDWAAEMRDVIQKIEDGDEEPASSSAVPPADHTERRNRYEFAIRAAGDAAYGNRPFYEAITAAVIELADAEQAELRRLAGETADSAPETPARHTPGKATLCPDCRAKGHAICMPDAPQPPVHIGGNADDCPACQTQGLHTIGHPYECPGPETAAGDGRTG